MDRDHARSLLLKERDRLQALHDHAGGNLGASQEEATGELTTADQHPADVGSETADREQDESMREHAQHELDEVAAALRRLDDGRYGRCAVCGEPIGDERLELLPQTRYCVTHQREREQA